MRTYVNLIGSIFSAFLLTLSFPKWNLWIIGFFSFVPMFFSFTFMKESKTVIISSFIFGVVHFSTLLYWLVYTLTKYGNLFPTISIFLLILLSSYLALYYVFLFYTNFKLKIFKSPNFIKGLFFSLAFVGMEYLRGILLTGFTWGQIGYILSNFSLLLQSADIWGIWGLSFIIALINYYVFYLLYSFYFSLRSFLNLNFLINNFFFLIIFISLLSYGIYQENFWENIISKENTVIKVSLLQGNIPQEMKEIHEIEYSLKVYKNLALFALKDKPDLIFFPETSFPFFFPNEKEPTLKLLNFLDELTLESKKLNHLPVLVFGTFRLKHKNGNPFVYNSLIVWDGKDFVDLYDKEKLVPFGEYVPLEKYFSFLRKITVGLGIVKPGFSKNLIVPVKKEIIKITPLICFESAFSEILRKRLKEDPRLIFIATNDAWFDKTSAPYQHFQMAIVRAVEARRYTIQVANTGITGIIDPTGRILKMTQLEKEEIVYGKIKLLYYRTHFIKYGNILGIAGSLILLFSFILILFLPRFLNPLD
ncbi:MAG: apolipoprotein N-acyltransferase [Thermodesulfobacterium geofontis]|uniref:Apolipoprotein N-acyltransferase n=2 Tax=Thermodesulfobacterium geofontis TaxID=1295609 RepID=A0A2N7PQD2_9BACT|nr:MAG: apolipoprotein N-acyltransferase [Thermodesulfobacterium geofontis]